MTSGMRSQHPTAASAIVSGPLKYLKDEQSNMKGSDQTIHPGEVCSSFFLKA
jgi:hypothetical protein